MKLHAWGKYPVISALIHSYRSLGDLASVFAAGKSVIAFGNGRSYGDSALSGNIVKMTSRNRFLDFDAFEGKLKCESGAMLADIIKVFLPRGWFLQVTPGTKLITVGGAIAADIHGKNHHQIGCFSECVESFSLILPDQSVVFCSRSQNADLFHATCGGMGLTGIITEATIHLKKVRSSKISQTTIKSSGLKETFDTFERYQNVPYSVAWIDCLASGDSLGRSLLMTGDFCDDGDLTFEDKKTINIPEFFPSFLLNNFTVKIFNILYYKKAFRKISTNKVSIDSFFYPLDALGNWNRIYGKNGFLQYQFILPKARSFEGLSEILRVISRSGKGSFLAVLKLYGPENSNLISFPIEGYSLALDFKIESGVFELLDQLDALVLKYGGRIYLAKDARVSREVFEKGYSRIDEFRNLRKKYHMNEIFNSKQSDRLAL